MKKNEFAILHELKSTQALVNTDFDHDEEKYTLTLKFWSKSANGFAEVTMSWPSDKEKEFKACFDKFKDPAECEKVVNNFESM